MVVDEKATREIGSEGTSRHGRRRNGGWRHLFRPRSCGESSWSCGALEGAAVVGGLSALGAGLYSIGIPKDSVFQYETAVKDVLFKGIE